MHFEVILELLMTPFGQLSVDRLSGLAMDGFPQGVDDRV
jgi:hypothetical protein